MRNYKIARRYTKALILIAKEDGLADRYRKELEGFVDVLDKEQDFEAAISNPLYPAEQ